MEDKENPLPPKAPKSQAIAWWIASIAMSVLCCSILFVLFAGYIVDIKQTIENATSRIEVIKDREDRILNEIENIRRHVILLKSAEKTNDPREAEAPQAPFDITVTVPIEHGTEKGAGKHSDGMASPGLPDPSSMPVPLSPHAPEKK